MVQYTFSRTKTVDGAPVQAFGSVNKKGTKVKGSLRFGFAEGTGDSQCRNLGEQYASFKARRR